jgi:hypothetical protein
MDRLTDARAIADTDAWLLPSARSGNTAPTDGQRRSGIGGLVRLENFVAGLHVDPDFCDLDDVSDTPKCPCCPIQCDFAKKWDG